MKKEELDEQFFDDDAVIPSIAIFSYEPAPPEDMGFFAPGIQEAWEQRCEKERSGAGNRWDYPYSTGEGGRRQKEEEKKDETLNELQLSPMDVDKVLVNGVELTQGFFFSNFEGSVFISAFQAVALS